MCVMSLPGLPPNILIYGVEQKNIVKFCNTCSVGADGLCISSPMLVGGRKAGNSNMLTFFLHHAVAKEEGKQSQKGSNYGGKH